MLSCDTNCVGVGQCFTFHSFPRVNCMDAYGFWHTLANPKVSRTSHKRVHNAYVLFAMVVKIACTMCPTKLLHIMQFGLHHQHGRHVVAYLITLRMQHPSYLRNLLQACIHVTYHGNSLLMQFQACRICCFGAIALRSSDPHTH